MSEIVKKKGWLPVRHGSSKNIYRAGHDILAFESTDFYSVFDVGRALTEIPKKGSSVSHCAEKSFQIAQTLGIPTHFIERADETTLLVREAQIIKGMDISCLEEDYVIPLEFICRARVAGSIERAFQSGQKDPTKYGFPPGVIPAFGTPFPETVLELTTKWEHVDRPLTKEEACRIAGLTFANLDEIWEMIKVLAAEVALAMAPGLYVADGKFEVIMGPGRKPMIGDVFGTPDEDRPYYLAQGEEGEAVVVHCSKEYIRQIHEDSGYRKILMEARARGEGDPPIPPLTEDQVSEASRRYRYVAKVYTGVNI